MWAAAPTLAATAVQIDKSRALHRPDELATLVGAVMEALETELSARLCLLLVL